MPARAPRRALLRLALLGTAAALTAGACLGPLASPTPVPASSDSTTDNRSVAAFSAVSVEGPLHLVLAVGSGASVDVVGPSNVVPLVQTTVANGELDVTVAAPGFTSANPVTVRVTAPRLASVSLGGGASGTVEAMGSSLAVSVSGGSSLKGIGTVAQLAVTALGASTAELGDVTAETGTISAAGGAKATLNVVKQLTGTIDSGAIVTLVVAPAAKSVAVTGGAQLVLP